MKSKHHSGGRDLSARSGITVCIIILAQRCSWLHLKKAHQHREYHEHAIAIVNNTDVPLGEPNHWLYKFWDKLLTEPNWVQIRSASADGRWKHHQHDNPVTFSCDLQVQVYKSQLQRYLQQRSAFFLVSIVDAAQTRNIVVGYDASRQLPCDYLSPARLPSRGCACIQWLFHYRKRSFFFPIGEMITRFVAVSHHWEIGGVWELAHSKKCWIWWMYGMVKLSR